MGQDRNRLGRLRISNHGAANYNHHMTIVGMHMIGMAVVYEHENGLLDSQTTGE